MIIGSVELDDGVEFYEFLEVEREASLEQIKRQYRRKALQYHPDKNPSEEAKRKFNQLSIIYEILSNEELRKRYDEWRFQEEVSITSGDGKRNQFQEELKKRERVHRDSTRVYDEVNQEYVHKNVFNNKVDLLREEGIRLRRLEEGTKARKNHLSYKEMRIPRYHYVKSGPLSHGARVTWKHKPELKGQFNEEVLGEIMGQFGQVTSAQIIDDSGRNRYDSGVVEFEEFNSYQTAINHDYKSAKLWDGTPVRKLASLLRGCRPTRTAYDNEKVNQLMASIPSDYRFNEPSSGILGEYLDSMVAKQLNNL